MAAWPNKSDTAVQFGSSGTSDPIAARSSIGKEQLDAGMCRWTAAIDAAFAGMADDSEYLQEALTLAEGFVVAEWEAFVQTETHL